MIGNAELLLSCGKYDSVIFSMDLVKVMPKDNFPYNFPFKIQTKLDNSLIINFCIISLYQDVKRK
ncbi:hypothetical protein JN06_01009 [Bacteroides zoogleoformans]|nr:hypothetical protein JN06_01009 [Bacteroides zoogleoformans]